MKTCYIFKCFFEKYSIIKNFPKKKLEKKNFSYKILNFFLFWKKIFEKNF